MSQENPFRRVEFGDWSRRGPELLSQLALASDIAGKCKILGEAFLSQRGITEPYFEYYVDEAVRDNATSWVDALFLADADWFNSIIFAVECVELLEQNSNADWEIVAASLQENPLTGEHALERCWELLARFFSDFDLESYRSRDLHGDEYTARTILSKGPRDFRHLVTTGEMPR